MTLTEAIIKHRLTGQRFTNTTIGSWLTEQDGFLYAAQRFTPTVDAILGDDWFMEEDLIEKEGVGHHTTTEEGE